MDTITEQLALDVMEAVEDEPPLESLDPLDPLAWPRAPPPFRAPPSHAAQPAAAVDAAVAEARAAMAESDAATRVAALSMRAASRDAVCTQGSSD